VIIRFGASGRLGRAALMALICAAAAPIAAQAQSYYDRPYGGYPGWGWGGPPPRAVSPYASRRAIAGVLAEQGYRLVGRLDFRGADIVAVGVDGYGRTMRFVVDPDDGDIVDARPVVRAAARPDMDSEDALPEPPRGALGSRRPEGLAPPAPPRAQEQGRRPQPPVASHAEPSSRDPRWPQDEPASRPAARPPAERPPQTAARPQDRPVERPVAAPIAPAGGSSHRAIAPPPAPAAPKPAPTVTATPVAPAPQAPSAAAPTAAPAPAQAPAAAQTSVKWADPGAAKPAPAPTSDANKP
jgi:hypothetical protein